MKKALSKHTRNTPFRRFILLTTLLGGWSLVCHAAVIINFDFDGDGASDGDSLTSTANSGTLGGSATGNHPAPDTNTSPQYETSANGSLGAMTIGGGTTFKGNISYAKGVTTTNTDFTVAFALRRDGEQSQFNRITDMPEMGISLSWVGGSSPTPGNDQIRLNYGNAGGGVVPDSGSIADGVWSHVAFTYNYNTGSPILQLYLNGELVGSDNNGIPVKDLGAAQSIYLLSRSNPDRTISGAIDNFQIHDSVLNMVQINELGVQSGAIIPEPGSLSLLLIGFTLIIAFRKKFF